MRACNIKESGLYNRINMFKARVPAFAAVQWRVDERWSREMREGRLEERREKRKERRKGKGRRGKTEGRGREKGWED